MPIAISAALVLAVMISILAFMGPLSDTATAAPAVQGLKTRIERMPALDQNIALLRNNGAAPDVQMQAINEMLSMVLAPPIPLPTNYDDADPDTEVTVETTHFYNRTLLDLFDTIAALTDVKENPENQGHVRAMADEVGVVLEGALSAIRGMAQHVAQHDPRDSLPNELRGEAHLEAPFLPWQSGGGRLPDEAIVTGKIADGETMIVMKEVFGIKAVLYDRIIPIYQEPWDARVSPIIGFKVVWYIRWVPAEHIKTISYTRNATTGKLKMKVNQKQILNPGVSKMWHFYPAGPGVVQLRTAQ